MNSGSPKILIIIKRTIQRGGKKIHKILFERPFRWIEVIRMRHSINSYQEVPEAMSLDKHACDDQQNCELCDQKMNPTVMIYNHHTRLCTSCYHHMEKMPDLVAKSIERFLIGNVV